MRIPSKSSSPRSALTRSAFRSLATLSVTATAGLLSLSGTAQAADDIWVFSGDPTTPTATNAVSGGGTGNYDDGPTNYWSLGVKPTANANNAVINNAGTVNITANETPTDFLVNTIAGGSGTFNQTAGTVTQSVGWFRLGTFANTSLAPQSNYNLSGGTLTQTAGVTQQFNIGESAFSNVQMTISGTGAVSGGNSGIFQVGAGANSVGVLNVNTGGTFTFSPTVAPGGTGINANNNTISIGNAGNGTLNIGGGAVNLQPTVGGNFSTVVGRASGSNGTVNLTSGVLNVGSATAVQELWISAATGATGTVNVSGGTLNVSSWLATGRGGNNGTLNQTGGTINAAINGGNVTTAGSAASAVGNVNITGGTFNTPNNIYVTESGTGTWSIGGTGVVNEFGGGGFKVTNGGTLGTVNLGDGTVGNGLLSVNNVSSTNTSATASIFNFNGGTLQSKFNNGAFFVVGQANVRNAGAIIDSNAVNITVGQALLHSNIAGDNATDGGLTKVGTGALILTNAGNNYTGNTVINAGVVDAQVAGSLPGLNTPGRVTVNSTGILAVGVGYGTSTIADVDTARASNTFNSGAGIGVDVNTGTTSTYATNLVNDAGANGASTGFAKLGGGTLTLTGANTYSGITRFYGGVLGGNIGTGPLVFNGGNWQVLASNTVDYSARAVTFNGTAGIDTNGNNVTLGSAIAGLGGGSLTKQGLGTLTLTGGFNFSPTRAYTPGVQVLGNVFVQAGTLTLSGAAEAINTGGNFNSIGQAPGNFGTLSVVNGATFTTTSDFNVADVGGGTATTPVNALNGGVLNLSGTGSAITAAQVFIGKGGNATTNGALAIGVMNESGGTFTANNNSQIGVFGQGQLNLSGGTYTQAGGPYLSIGRYTGGFGVVDVSGTGVLNFAAPTGRLIVGEVGTGVLNVRNGGVVNDGSATNASGGNLTSALAGLTIGNTAGGVGIVNLLPGGTISTLSVGGLNNATTGILNFSGGTLKNNAATGTFIQNLTTANVYGNVGGNAVSGAVFDTTAGNATVAQALIAPAGNGITSIPTTGTGFATTPIVQITGGGGVGATAVATVDASGNVTGYTVTNPGTGYTSAPTVTVSGPSGTVVTTTANIGANVSGGLIKQGVNTLTLAGANTYTGVTTISAGTLALSATGSIANSTQISVGTGTTFDVSAAAFTAGAAQTINGVGTINSGAAAFTLNGTLSPGATTAAGDTGTLTITTTGTLTLAGTAITQFDIVNAATKDLLSFTGAGATLNVNGTLALRGTITPGTTYTIASGLTNESGNFAAVTGVPANYAPTYTFTGGNYNVTFAVPEPSTWALGVFGLAGMASVWMRRRRVA